MASSSSNKAGPSKSKMLHQGDKMRPLYFLGCFILFSFVSVNADDWTRFRGPNGSGVSQDSGVPPLWTKTKNIAWKREIPGSGHSSPIITKGKVFLQSASTDGSQRMLFCLNEKTGNIEWVKTVDAAKAHIHQKNSLASSTPAADGERIYTIFWTGKSVFVYAYDYSGKELWNYELGGYISQHGVGMSPVVHDGLVYVNYDQDGAAEFVCLEAATGKKAWSAPRKANRACYTNPLVRTLASGEVEIINASTTCITAYEPKKGAVKWNWDWKFSGMPLRTVAATLLVGDTLVQFSGDGGGSSAAVALKLGDAPSLMWEVKRDTPYVPAGVVYGEHIYFMSDAGFASCLEIKSGKIIWQERVFTKAVSASTVLFGTTVLAVAEDGKAVAFKATPSGLEKAGESSVGEAVFASPAVANGKLFIRGANTLFAIGK